MIISILVGFVAGFIDSIAGGGGLITLPYLTLLLVEPAHAVGTNKIVGFAGALTAFLVYQYKNKIAWREGILFCLIVACGSWVGSKITPHIPPLYFAWTLLFASPFLIYLIWSGRLFSKAGVTQRKAISQKALLAAFACGLYDGAFGPGGGTFMLMALLMVANQPLLYALTLSKLANSFSAGTALVSFAMGSYVHWELGFTLAGAMVVGAFVGSRLTSKHTLLIVRPTMLLVIGLLMFSLFQKLHS